MPYKDPDKRRTYQREYKRRQRVKKKLSNLSPHPQSTPRKVCQTTGQPRKNGKQKAYVCQKLPNLRLPRLIQFKNGLFVTDQPEDQMTIESDPLYGKEIFSWVLEP